MAGGQIQTLAAGTSRQIEIGLRGVFDLKPARKSGMVLYGADRYGGKEEENFRI